MMISSVRCEHRYKFKFLSEPDDALKCQICLKVAEEPLQHGDCGRLFCRKCLSTLEKDRPCPSCKMAEPQFFKDNRSYRDVNNLQVVCFNSADCSWKGTLGELKPHVTICKYALVPCPKNCKDEHQQIKFMKRCDIGDHLTKCCPNQEICCKDCGLKDTRAIIASVHVDVCEKKRIPCPNFECTKIVQRQNIKRHLNSCGFTEIPCKYRRVGCEVSVKRKDMASHERDKMKLHLQKTFFKLIALEDRINDSRSSVFRFENFQSKINLGQVIEKAFYTTTSGYKMAITIYPNGCGLDSVAYVSVFLNFLAGVNDSALTWPIHAHAKIMLLNQLEDSNHTTRLVISESSVAGDSSKFGISQFIHHSQLHHNPSKKTQYLLDDVLYFRVLVDFASTKPWLG